MEFSTETYNVIFEAVLPKYDQLAKYIATKWYNTDIRSEDFEERYSQVLSGMFLGVRGFMRHKIQDASEKQPEELVEILLSKGDAYIKTSMWNVKSRAQQKIGRRYSASGGTYYIDETPVRDGDDSVFDTISDRITRKY